jgi:hypothetical protein
LSTTITTFRLTVDSLLGAVDTDELPEATIDEQIKAAVERYSREVTRPDYVLDLAGDGGKYYAIAANLTNWSEGFSTITSIQYDAPALASDESPVYLDPEDWDEDYWTDLSGTHPASTETMRISYTWLYAWSGSPEATTTPTGDYYAICYLAAGLCCRMMQAKYAAVGDSAINADSAAHSDKSSRYAQAARDFIDMYQRHIGLSAGSGEDGAMGKQPFGEFVDWDTYPGGPSDRTFMFRHRGTR